MSRKDIVTGTFRVFFGTHLFLYVFHVYFGWLATQSMPPPHCWMGRGGGGCGSGSRACSSGGDGSWSTGGGGRGRGACSGGRGGTGWGGCVQKLHDITKAE